MRLDGTNATHLATLRLGTWQTLRVTVDNQKVQGSVSGKTVFSVPLTGLGPTQRRYLNAAHGLAFVGLHPTRFVELRAPRIWIGLEGPRG